MLTVIRQTTKNGPAIKQAEGRSTEKSETSDKKPRHFFAALPNYRKKLRASAFH